MRMYNQKFTYLERKSINKFLTIVDIKDSEVFNIIGLDFHFFDIDSKKIAQYGFSVDYAPDEKLTFLGDEPYNPIVADYALNSDWLIHDALCIDSEAERYKPAKHFHSTVKQASQTANDLNVKNLVLFHTEDNTLPIRKERFTKEAEQYFNGNIYVPDDLEVIKL